MKIIISIAFVLTCSIGFSQGLFEYFKLTADGDGIEKFDRIAVDLNYDTWLNTPKGIETGNFSIGVNAYWFKDMPLDSASHVALAIGLGISAHNVHHNGEFVKSVVNGNTVTHLNVLPESVTWKKNKFLVNYFDIPFELRFRNMHIRSKKQDGKTRSFRFYPGFKAGILMSNHTKWIDSKIKYKLYNLDNTLPYRYGLSCKIGFGKFVLAGFYSLTPLFEKGKRTRITPNFYWFILE